MPETMSRQTQQHAETEIVVERHIRADPARVYRALTDAKELEKWFFTDARTDPRQGGDYRMTWRSRADPGRDHDRFGKYLELVPNSRIVFEWRGAECGSNREMPDTSVAITLTPKDGGTLIRLVHSGWPRTSEGQNARGPHVDGWNFYMDNLASFLTGGPDRREETFGQLVRR